MPKLRVVSAAAAGLISTGAAATARAAVRHSRVAADVQRRLQDTTYERLADIGTVDALSVLPLVDRRVARSGLRGEPGVSYLVRAGGELLLFDTGLNLWGRSRSPLVDNAEALGVDLGRVPAVVLSHAHEDHVGGTRARRAGTFAFSGAPIEPRGLVVYAPVPLTHAAAAVRVTTRATVLATGVALLPPLPVALFWDGTPVLEQALVVNVRGAGLVLISGCGHPGMAAMLDVAQAVLDAPLHGIIGGLHLPAAVAEAPAPGADRVTAATVAAAGRPRHRRRGDPATCGRGVAGRGERSRQHATYDAEIGCGVRRGVPGGPDGRRNPRPGQRSATVAQGPGLGGGRGAGLGMAAWASAPRPRPSSSRSRP